jgi:hypothetical protein
VVSPISEQEADGTAERRRLALVESPSAAPSRHPGEVLRQPPRVLLWCNYDPYNAATICDHVNALAKFSELDVFVVSRLGNLPDDIDLDDFDAVIIHYSLALALEAYVSTRAKHRLRNYRGLKIQFIQDEYRFVNATVAAMAQCGIDLVFTCLKPEQIPLVYSPTALPNTRFHQMLTGYAPWWPTLYPTVPLKKRKIDVGYRGREYPSWHGRAGREKVEIGRRFLEDAPRYNLKCNIKWREGDRLYGRAWRTFLQDCRATLAVESGCSRFDFDGTLGPRAETYQQLLEGGKVARDAIGTFGDVPEDRINMSQVSPRVFEAAALRSLLIMYEGHYSGVTKPWRHFVPLRKDHSNMDEVVRFLRDDGAVSEMIANTFGEVALNPRYSYQAFVAEFDDVVKRLLPKGDFFGKRTVERAQFANAFPFYAIDNPHELDTPTTSKPTRFARRVVGGVRRRLVRLLKGA